MAASPKMLHIWWTDLSQLKGWEHNGLMLNFRSFAPNYLWILAWDLQFTERTFLAKVFFVDLCQVEWAGREQQATTNPSHKNFTCKQSTNQSQCSLNNEGLMHFNHFGAKNKTACLNLNLRRLMLSAIQLFTVCGMLLMHSISQIVFAFMTGKGPAKT